MRRHWTVISALLAGLALAASSEQASADTAILAGGCFWCVEADFEKVEGVQDAVSGFTGGTVANPSYSQVTRGGTGHYEAVRITFNPSVVTYAEILDLFLRSVDPLDPGGQFCDRGDSYRTAIFATPDQKAAANAAIAAAQAELGRPIQTPVLQASTFYPAEKYHQNYYRKDDLILTRFGPKSKKDAYKLYREGCGRDARIREIWGKRAAPFVK